MSNNVINTLNLIKLNKFNGKGVVINELKCFFEEDCVILFCKNKNIDSIKDLKLRKIFQFLNLKIKKTKSIYFLLLILNVILKTSKRKDKIIFENFKEFFLLNQGSFSFLSFKNFENFLKFQKNFFLLKEDLKSFDIISLKSNTQFFLYDQFLLNFNSLLINKNKACLSFLLTFFFLRTYFIFILYIFLQKKIYSYDYFTTSIT